MQTYLATDWGKLLVVPLAFLLINVFVRRLGRRDGDKSPRRNDWAVATSVLMMVIATIVRDIQNTQIDPSGGLTWIVVLLASVFVSTDHDRHRSWIHNPTTGTVTEHKRLWVGIVLPDIVSIVVFVGYLYLKEVG